MPITPADIRARMAELGLTQAELARRAGMSRQRVSDLLAGRQRIGMAAADQLAAALDAEVQMVPRSRGRQSPRHRAKV